VKYVKDKTGRLNMRPHFEPIELDRECEQIICAFLKQKYGEIRLPIPTDAMDILIEQDAQDLDKYADLSAEGEDVEGVTEFIPGQKPRVKISARLSENPRLENRLRTTLAHEWGHVKFHAPLWLADTATPDLFGRRPEATSIKCKRDNIFGASEYDWMEWQAGYVCGAVLMPHTRVKAIAKEHLESLRQPGPLDVNSQAASDLIERVVKAFQVSADAARVRMIKLKILSELGRGLGLPEPGA
jgi:IrrE N-terminal-like domain